MNSLGRLSARFHGQLPPHPLDGWCRWGGFANALCSWGAIAILAQSASREEALSAWTLLSYPLAVALLLPALLARLHAVAAKRQWDLAPTRWWHFILLLGLIPYLVATSFHGFALLLALVAIAHGSCLNQAHRFGAALVASLIPLLLGLAIFPFADTLLSRLLVALIFPLTVGNWMLIQAREQDRFLRRQVLIQELPAPASDELLRRLGLGASIGLGLLLLTFFLPLPTPSDRGSGSGAGSKGGPSTTEASAEEKPLAGQVRSLPPLDDPTLPPSQAQAAPPARPSFPGHLAWDQALMPPTARPWRTLFQLRPEFALKRSESTAAEGAEPAMEPPVPTLYLGVRHYVEIAEEGLKPRPGARSVRYGQAGGSGEWAWLEIDDQPARGAALVFSWRGFPLRLAPGEGREDLAILPHLRPLLAAQVAELHRFEDGLTLCRAPGPKPFVARWMCPASALEAEIWQAPVTAERLPPLQLAEAADPMLLRLPQSDALDDWLDEVRTEARALPDPRARLQAAMAHYQDFRFRRQGSPIAGLASLLDFRATHRGSALQFAAALALELRAVGIPCRLVSGFRLNRWSSRSQAYLGSEAEAHLWLELPTAAGAWLTLEATPAGALDALLAEDFAAAREALAQSGEAVSADAEAADPVEALQDGARQEELPTGPTHPHSSWSPLSMSEAPLLALLAGLYLLWRYRRHHRKTPGSAASAPTRPNPPTWGQILQLLASEGLHREQAETMTEFARAAAAEGLGLPTTWRRAVQSHQRYRFGDHVWREQDEQDALALLESIESMLMTEA